MLQRLFDGKAPGWIENQQIAQKIEGLVVSVGETQLERLRGHLGHFVQKAEDGIGLDQVEVLLCRGTQNYTTERVSEKKKKKRKRKKYLRKLASADGHSLVPGKEVPVLASLP